MENIIYDIEKIKPSTVNNNLKSNQEIAAKLFKILVANTTGNKLACNQVGIFDHRVAVVNIREPLYLVNPEIVVFDIPIPYISDDLSFPQKLVNTQRYARIVVKADNFKKPISFGIKDNNSNMNITNPIIMEVCAIQHVIDMLNGITMYDRELKIEKQPVINSGKFYRNQIVSLEKEGGQPIRIKFKHASKYLKEGWIIKSE